jgi:hypothetical protein
VSLSLIEQSLFVDSSVNILGAMIFQPASPFQEFKDNLLIYAINTEMLATGTLDFPSSDYIELPPALFNSDNDI